MDKNVKLNNFSLLSASLSASSIPGLFLQKCRRQQKEYCLRRRNTTKIVETPHENNLCSNNSKNNGNKQEHHQQPKQENAKNVKHRHSMNLSLVRKSFYTTDCVDFLHDNIIIVIKNS